MLCFAVIPAAESTTVPGVVSVIAWNRWPPWTAVTALPTVVPPDAVVSVKLSARLPSVPTPLLPLASPARVTGGVVTAVPASCANASAGVNVMPEPVEDTEAPAAWAWLSPGVNAMPLPRPRIVVPAACGFVSAGLNVMPEPGSDAAAPIAWPVASAGANVTPVPGLERSRTVRPVAWTIVRSAVSVRPVPVAPAVPTPAAAIVATSWPAPEPIRIESPAAKPVTLLTLMLLAEGELGSVSAAHGLMPYRPESATGVQLASLNVVPVVPCGWVQSLGLLEGWFAATDVQLAGVSVQFSAVVSHVPSAAVWITRRLSGTPASAVKSSCSAAIMLPAPAPELFGATAMTLLPAFRYGLTLTSWDVRQPLATLDEDTSVPLT